MCWNGGRNKILRFQWMFFNKMLTIVIVKLPFKKSVKMIPWQALLSLESASKKMFPASTPAGGHVKIHWAVEREPACQKILGPTYGTCCFDDVMNLGNDKHRLFCTTHQKFCPAHVEDANGRISSSTGFCGLFKSMLLSLKETLWNLATKCLAQESEPTSQDRRCDLDGYSNNI